MKRNVGMMAAIMAVMFFLVGADNAVGQTSAAQVSGQITDQSGAVIPGAKVTVTNNDSGVARYANSNESGNYTVPLLQPGNFRILVEVEGFKPVVLPRVTLEVNQAIQQSFALELGDLVETVEVAAQAELIQSSTAELGTVINEQAVVDLPLNGRNFTQLLTLQPGASPANVTQNSGGGLATAGVGEQAYPALNGQGNRSNVFLTDGAINVGTARTTYAVPPIVDAIQEFKVQSHNDMAEFGGANGGIVNVVTRSGTNTLHGSGWWFLRNDNLDARDAFRTEVTPLAQNMFGGTLGGPIQKNKTFYFLAYQGYTNRRPANNLFRVPTEANLTGDMSDWHQQIYDPFSTRLDSTAKSKMARDPFPGNKIPANRLDPGYLDFVRKTVPAPNYSGVADRNHINLLGVAQNQHEYQARVDHTFSDKDMVWGRFGGQYYDDDSPGGRESITSYDDLHTSSFSAAWLHTFDPSSMFEVQLGHNRVDSDAGARFMDLPDGYAATIGLDSQFVTFSDGEELIPNLSVNEFFGGGETNTGSKFTDTWQVRGSYSKIAGNHQLKFGGEFTYDNFDIISRDLNSTFASVGSSDPNNQAKTGSPLASFLLDVPDSASRRQFFKDARFGGVWGVYAQDSWKVTSKLTINLGLRYNFTMLPPIGDHESRTIYHGTWDFMTGNYILQADPGACNVVGSAPCIPTADGSLPPRVVIDPREKLLHDSNDNWQPRFGFAYRVRQTTVVRGSFGLFFDNFAGIQQVMQNTGHTWPDVGRYLSNGLNRANTSQLVPTISGKNPYPDAQIPEDNPNTRGAHFTDPYLKNAYSMQWNFGVQQQLSSTTDVAVNYVGSGNRRQPMHLYYNVALTPGPGNPALRRPFPDVIPNWWQTSWSRSNYNALQAQLRKRFSSGLSILTNYTWSKAIDIGRSGWFAEDQGSTGSSIQDPYNFNNERGLAGHDLTHMFNVSWTYELPFGVGRRSLGNSVLDAVLGDWQFNGIARFTSGQPYTINMNGDNANTGMLNGHQRPNVLRDPTLEDPTVNEWFDKGAVAVPAQFTFGNIGRNVLRRDGMNNFDLSLFKKIPLGFIREGLRMELRFEAFNAFNSPQFNKPDSNISSANFGRVLSTANNPRQIQVGAKLYF